MFPLPKEDKMVSPFFVFYLIHAMQVGVGILGFERVIVQSAGYSAWIAILASGASIIGLIWISYRILNKGNNDIVAIHADIMGKWIGGFFSFLFSLYFLSFALVVLRSYVEVIQVWVFPEVSQWIFVLIIIFLAYSYVTGGFRVVTGVSYLGILYGLPLLLVKFYPLQYADYGNLLPIFNASPADLFKASKEMTLNFLGFETLFMFYPFIKDGPKSEKWAYFGVLFSIFIYLLTAFVTFVYFNQEQLKGTIWATLTLWKIVDLIIVERFEYIGISVWFFTILPNICIGLWCASRGMNRLFPVSQRNALKMFCLLLFMISVLLTDRQQIDVLQKVISQIGLYTIYFYLPFLLVLQYIIMKVKKG
ncbi:spore germination protein (amino acid permease) [Cytobacillus firmus]|uniref:Spore germination protein (Amino acid permease) n=2 Tax=Cytobacillus TaxID=2675230 RepID=A0A366JM12_CYTFI|nr:MULTISPECIES: GerAB/ArcD/ProY family transporter [Cytobacillus]RBP88765.1 spore germination protein (amino acid permease) [Cytobacillus firmus]TDX39550.1 spore germination protein (amino acid permease) [Cytobacillus oceanisediminis]